MASQEIGLLTEQRGRGELVLGMEASACRAKRRRRNLDSAEPRGAPGPRPPEEPPPSRAEVTACQRPNRGRTPGIRSGGRSRNVPARGQAAQLRGGGHGGGPLS